MSKAASLAKKTKNRVEWLEGLEKVKVEDVLKKFPTVTITGYGFLPDKMGGRYPVFRFLEDEKSFFCGGVQLTAIAQIWEENEITNEDLNTEPVKMSLKMAKAKNGRDMVDVTIVE